MELMSTAIGLVSWCTKRAFSTPSGLIDPTGDGVVMQVKLFAPFDKSHSDSTNGDVRCVALIPVLCSPVCPSTILRFIVSVVINAINGVFRGWLKPHIIQKVSETIYPSVTDLDAASAIVNISVVGDIGTSYDHVIPRAIFCNILHSQAVLLCGVVIAVRKLLSTKASATLRSSIPKRLDSYHFSIATGTPAQAMPRAANAIQDRPPSEFLTDNVYRLHDNIVQLRLYIVNAYRGDSGYNFA
jgi:hypothetical protein